ncbi:MAG: glucuronate isomerase [Oscillospiraceae bacterium]
MKKFLDKDFLLDNEVSKKLYHDYAKDMPIFDYHNHLNPKEIYEDKKFDNISKLWLGADHYKWRVLRSNGITEDYITGNKSDYEKFVAFAKTIPYTLGNPMYHWAHLELQRYFDIHTTLSEDTADEIYNKCNEMLKEDNFSVRNLLRRAKVTALCTTDDPKDDLKYHKLLKEEGFDIKVLPTFRPDNIIHIEKPMFLKYLRDLKDQLNVEIKTVDDVKNYLIDRINYFDEVGCRVSDHGLDQVMYLESSLEEVNEILQKGLNGDTLTINELRKYKGYLLSFLGKEYNKKGWAMQYHIGPMRNNSTRMFNKLGSDAGFDSINDGLVAVDLSRLLDSMDISDELPKTVLYCLNPSDNAVLASMLGNFQSGGIVGKIQFGSGWWFMDTKKGMIDQMEDLASMGLLSRFVGMLTDSRSFLSFPRHEYFRRIMCNEIGKLVTNGEYPEDYKILGSIVEGICYNNIKNYIKI